MFLTSDLLQLQRVLYVRTTLRSRVKLPSELEQPKASAVASPNFVAVHVDSYDRDSRSPIYKGMSDRVELLVEVCFQLALDYAL